MIGEKTMDKEEPFFGENIKDAYKVLKGMFKKEKKVRNLLCPFCFSRIKKKCIIQQKSKDKSFEICYVECPDCRCTGPVSYSAEGAVREWNIRGKKQRSSTSILFKKHTGRRRIVS